MEILSILKPVYSDPMFLFSFHYQFFIGLSIFLNLYFISLNVYFIFLNVSRHDLCCSVDIDAFLSLSLSISQKRYAQGIVRRCKDRMEWTACRVCGTIIILIWLPVSLSVCVRKSECECRHVVVSLAVSPCSLSYLCHSSDTLIPLMWCFCALAKSYQIN